MCGSNAASEPLSRVDVWLTLHLCLIWAWFSSVILFNCYSNQ
jgi:hypothetical protein